jgi:Xaa-Pro aminopeptidase
MTSAARTAGISVPEFAERQARATAIARGRGLKGLLVCSRGGGTIDRHANVLYLANFYTPFPYIPDRRPEWSARGHAFFLLPSEAKPVLVIDVPYFEHRDLPVEDIVIDADTVGAVVEQLRTHGLSEGAVGIVGTDTVPWSVARQLEAELPHVTWAIADDILDGMRMVKSPAEISILAQASDIGSRTIDAMLDAAQPGITHGEIVAAGLRVMIPAGAILYNSFMSSGAGGEQPTIISHNFPTYGASAALANGQWFRVGLSGAYDGYYFDLARSTAVGRTTPEQIDAFEAAIASVQACIAAIRPGATAGDIASAGNRRLQDLGYPDGGAFSGFGHGVGLGWDSPWLVPGDTTKLQPAMVLSVERMVRRRGYMGDFEETVLITENGTQTLTTARTRRW